MTTPLPLLLYYIEDDGRKFAQAVVCGDGAVELKNLIPTLPDSNIISMWKLFTPRLLRNPIDQANDIYVLICHIHEWYAYALAEYYGLISCDFPYNAISGYAMCIELELRSYICFIRRIYATVTVLDHDECLNEVVEWAVKVLNHILSLSEARDIENISIYPNTLSVDDIINIDSFYGEYEDKHFPDDIYEVQSDDIIIEDYLIATKAFRLTIIHRRKLFDYFLRQLGMEYSQVPSYSSPYTYDRIEVADLGQHRGENSG